MKYGLYIAINFIFACVSNLSDAMNSPIIGTTDVKLCVAYMIVGSLIQLSPLMKA